MVIITADGDVVLKAYRTHLSDTISGLVNKLNASTELSDQFKAGFSDSSYEEGPPFSPSASERDRDKHMPQLLHTLVLQATLLDNKPPTDKATDRAFHDLVESVLHLRDMGKISYPHLMRQQLKTCRDQQDDVSYLSSKVASDDAIEEGQTHPNTLEGGITLCGHCPTMDYHHLQAFLHTGRSRPYHNGEESEERCKRRVASKALLTEQREAHPISRTLDFDLTRDTHLTDEDEGTRRRSNGPRVTDTERENFLLRDCYEKDRFEGDDEGYQQYEFAQYHKLKEQQSRAEQIVEQTRRSFMEVLREIGKNEAETDEAISKAESSRAGTARAGTAGGSKPGHGGGSEMSDDAENVDGNRSGAASDDSDVE